MNATRICPQCGTALPAGAPAWLCSKCLLAQAVEGPGAEEEPVSAAPLRFDESMCGPLGRPLPSRLGDYELVERIGQGGMGVVYRARQVSLDRDVAVKVLSPTALGSPEAVHRFQTEAVTAGSLLHPNIVAVHEVGHAEGLPYLVMDYVAGPTLGDLVRNGPLPTRQAVLYLRTIAEAVHFAHERGVLHRDLKPSNVLLDANDQPRVTDFGLAKRLVVPPSGGPDKRSVVPPLGGPDAQGPAKVGTTNELTLSGQVLGSPAFIPPEQASGDRGRLGRRSDVYALGAILYQLLTGRPPFVGEALADMLRQVLNEDPLSPRVLNPAVPRDLETVCLKCLEKEPDRRYPTAKALAEELGRWLDHRPILARHLGPVAKTWRWRRRNPRLAALTAGLALAIVGGFVGVLTQWQRAKAAELTARRHAYAADMNLVQQALADGDLSTAQELLERYRPDGRTEVRGQRSEVSAAKTEIRNQKSETDLRGWEWRYLWARSRSEERFTLHEYPGAVSALAFSPDGRWLAVRWEEEGLELWDAVAKQPVARLPARNAMGWHWCSKALAFSPQENLLAWGNADGTNAPVVSVRDLGTQREIRSLPHTSDLVSVAFSPDAKLLAGLADDGVLRVWDLESGQVVTNLSTPPARDPAEGPAASGEANATATAEATTRSAEPGAQARRPVVRSVLQTEHYGCVQFSPDGRWLAVGEAQPRVRIWDWTTRQEIEPLTLPADADGITAVAFSPDSTRLAVGGGGGSGEVRVWDLAARAERQFTGHRARVIGLAFSPDGQRLASGSADQTLRLWDVATGSHLRLVQGNTAEIWALAWSPDGQDLVTGARDGTVRYWDPNSKATPACAVLPSQVWSFGLAFTPDSRTFLTVNNATSTIEKWDLATLRSESLPRLGAGHGSLDLSPDGDWLALAETNGHVQIWDFHAQRLVADRAVPEASMLVGARFSPRGRYVGSAALVAEGSLPFKIWEAPAWREVSLQHFGLTNLFGLDFTPDERTLAIGYYDGAAAWKDLATGTTRAFFPPRHRHGGGMHVKFSADGRWFVTGGVMNGLMTLCDVARRRPRYIGPDSPYVLHTLAFSPDGGRLVTSGASLGDLFRVWDVTTGRHLLSLPAPIEGFYTRLGFSPDGNTLFAASLEGTTLLWRAPSWEEIEAAEQRQTGP